MNRRELLRILGTLPFVPNLVKALEPAAKTGNVADITPKDIVKVVEDSPSIIDWEYVGKISQRHMKIVLSGTAPILFDLELGDTFAIEWGCGESPLNNIVEYTMVAEIDYKTMPERGLHCEVILKSFAPWFGDSTEPVMPTKHKLSVDELHDMGIDVQFNVVPSFVSLMPDSFFYREEKAKPSKS